MTRTQILILILPLLTCLSCAGPGNMVVLLPDADGKTGKIEVANQAGRQLLGEPGQATAFRSADSGPSAPFHLEDGQVRSIFGEAIDGLPMQPIHITLYFISGSTTLTGESRRQFAMILPEAIARHSQDISVVGHTDRVGTRQANFALALNRARAVRDLLLAEGISPEKLELTSHGEDNPLIPTPDETPEPRNRRVEVIIR